MSMIDSEAQGFTVRAYQDYEFRPVTKEDLKGMERILLLSG